MIIDYIFIIFVWFVYGEKEVLLKNKPCVFNVTEFHVGHGIILCEYLYF